MEEEMLRRCTHAVRRSKSFGIVILSEESAQRCGFAAETPCVSFFRLKGNARYSGALAPERSAKPFERFDDLPRPGRDFFFAQRAFRRLQHRPHEEGILPCRNRSAAEDL